MNQETTQARSDRILVVDDTTANLQLLTNLLTEQGYIVHPASDGELALEFVQSTQPDLILLDVRMPGMDGYEVCRRLKEDDKSNPIPVIFVSILEDELDKVKGFQAGAVDYINKPFHPEEVIARVKTHLKLRHMQSDLELRNKELKLARDTLEERVRERTAELFEANANLTAEIIRRKRTEEALQEKTEELNRYFDSALDLLCIADTDGYFHRLNPEWESTLGFSLSELEGRRFLDFVHPDDMEQTLQAVSQLREQKKVLNFVNRYRSKSGSYRWIEWRSFPSGKHIYAVARDITKRKRVEEEIRQLNLELEQRVKNRTAQLMAANQEMEGFVYSVSHDLRAPLRHIDGFLELLQRRIEPAMDDQSRQYMARVADAARRMGILIDDLLSFSRMGRFEMSSMPVNFNDLVQDVIRELQSDEHGRDIHWKISDLPTVPGDRAMLRIVLANLISNALKFTRPRQPARIEIGSTTSQSPEAVIFVRDNGVGFDMTYVDKLFGVFQRLHREDEFEGTGIGLASVRRIINRHGGRTWAEGQVDQGAILYFALPLTQQGGGDERH